VRRAFEKLRDMVEQHENGGGTAGT
jgi:hypothetical protein